MRPHHIDLLAVFDADWTPAKSIEVDTGLPQSTCRSQLMRLVEMGVLEVRRIGRCKDYRITKAGDRAITEFGPETPCAS